MPTTLLDAITTVRYGDIGPDEFLGAIYAGRDPSVPLAVRSASRAHIDAAWSHPRGVIAWEGPIPDAVGHYVVANPYACSAVGTYDPSALLVGTGLTTAAIGEITTIACEVDEAEDGLRLSMEAQAAIYDDIEAETGIRFAAAVLSGDSRPGVEAEAKLGRFEVLAHGKSMHVFLALLALKPTPVNLAVRQEAVDALVALVNADAACRDVTRKMRFGGVIAREKTGSVRARVRVQTLLRAEATAYDLADVRDRLVALCDARGIDIPAKIAALQLVARARALARSWERAVTSGTVTTDEATDAAQALRGAALAVRKAGRVLPVQGKIVEAIGGPKGKVTVVTSSGEQREIHVVGTTAGAWDPSTTIITHTSGATGTAEILWASHLRGRRVPDVHCVGHADAHASAFLTRRKGGIYAAHCPVCGVIESSPLLPAHERTYALKAPTIDTSRPAALVAEREADLIAGVVPAVIEFAEEMGEALCDHPMVLARVERAQHDRRIDAIGDELSDPAEMSSGVSIDLGSRIYHHSPDDILSPDDMDDLVGEAVESLGGTTWIACTRGPLAVKAREGGYSEWRIPCKGASCPVCGPWMALARRTSSAVILRRLARDGWSGASPSRPFDAASIRATQRWVDGSPGLRAWIRARQLDGSVRDLLLWATPGDAPSGVLGRDLTPRLPEAWAVGAVPATPTQKGVRVLTGTGWLVGRIHTLIASVISQRPQKDALHKARVTGGTSEALREKIEEAAGSLARVVETKDGRYKANIFDQRRDGILTAAQADAILADQPVWRGRKRRKARVEAALSAQIDASGKNYVETGFDDDLSIDAV